MKKLVLAVCIVMCCVVGAHAEEISASASGKFCFVVDSGTVWSWGRNNYGQLGDGTNVDVLTPKMIEISVMSVVTGGSHTIGLKTDGTVWAWGWNRWGQLGDGTTTNRFEPIEIDVSGVQQISAGQMHTLILKVDGTVWAIGSNLYGESGLNAVRNVMIPA